MLLSYTLYAHNYVAKGLFYFSAAHIDLLLVAHPHVTAYHVVFTLIELFQHPQLSIDIE